MRRKSRKDAAKTKARKDRLGKEKKSKESPALPLKNGGEPMDVVWAENWAEELSELLDDYPNHFRTLVALVQNQSENINQGHVIKLKKWGYLGKDFSPLPDVKAVMIAALRVSGDGYCIADPLEVKTNEDVLIVKEVNDRLEKLGELGLKQLARIIFEGKGRSQRS